MSWRAIHPLAPILHAVTIGPVTIDNGRKSEDQTFNQPYSR
jgi:hypothetical protein